MDNLKVLEEKRLVIYDKYVKEQRSAILFFVGAILFGLGGFIGNLWLLYLPAGVLFVIAMVKFGQAMSHANSFRTLIKNELVLTLLKEQFDDVSYNAQASISLSEIMKTGTVKRPDRFHGEDYISGIYKGVRFEVSDVDLKERVETRDSKGNVTVSYQTYFKGRWYVYRFDRTFKDVLKIVEGYGMQANRKGLVKVDTESIEFNKKFSIFASTQEYAFYHITSSMIEKLLELEKLHRGSILYCYMGNELHIGVNDRRDYMEISLKTPLNEEAMKDFLTDINLIPAIINELRLDSQKFKNTQ